MSLVVYMTFQTSDENLKIGEIASQLSFEYSGLYVGKSSIDTEYLDKYQAAFSDHIIFQLLS